MSGTLYIVATPIGNLEDISARALRTLADVDLIACEDTRQTRKLLTRYHINTSTVSYHEHNERKRSGELVSKLKAGMNIALVCDAGVPTISDPGVILVRRAIDEGLPVVPIPGPSAALAALMACGLPCDKFLFMGFLPPRQRARRRELEAVSTLPFTLVFFEAPHRIRAAVSDAMEELGDRPAVLARELTKIHEEFRRAPLSQLAEDVKAHPPRGEMVLIIAGAGESESRQSPCEELVYDSVVKLMKVASVDLKTAITRVAKARGWSKNEVYREYLRQKSDPEE